MPTIKERMKADLGLTDDQFGSHASDLYVVCTPEVRGWLKRNHDQFYGDVTSFTDNTTGKVMLEIPFGFWDEFMKTKRQ